MLQAVTVDTVLAVIYAAEFLLGLQVSILGFLLDASVVYDVEPLQLCMSRRIAVAGRLKLVMPERVKTCARDDPLDAV